MDPHAGRGTPQLGATRSSSLGTIRLAIAIVAPLGLGSLSLGTARVRTSAGTAGGAAVAYGVGDASL